MSSFVPSAYLLLFYRLKLVTYWDQSHELFITFCLPMGLFAILTDLPSAGFIFAGKMVLFVVVQPKKWSILVQKTTKMNNCCKFYLVLVFLQANSLCSASKKMFLFSIEIALSISISGMVLVLSLKLSETAFFGIHSTTGTYLGLWKKNFQGYFIPWIFSSLYTYPNFFIPRAKIWVEF